MYFGGYLSVVFCVGLGSEVEIDTLRKAVAADCLQTRLRPLMNKYLTAILFFLLCQIFLGVVQVIQKFHKCNRSKTFLYFIDLAGKRPAVCRWVTVCGIPCQVSLRPYKLSKKSVYRVTLFKDLKR